MTMSEIMSAEVAWCRFETPLQEVARLMTEHHCGEIPVCDDERRPIGVVTDRDIVCRVIAVGDDPYELSAGDCMSHPVVTATCQMSLEDGSRLMEQYKVRRLPVVDEAGACCGMVAQADLATKGPRDITAEVVGKISEPTEQASTLPSV
jgi:CBS domain-containing protein